MANNIFQGIVLKQRKILREKLAKEKMVREHQERIDITEPEKVGIKLFE
jgi:hypothetical protein